MFGLPFEETTRFKALPRFRDSLFPLRISTGFTHLGDRGPLPSLHCCKSPEEIHQGILGGTVEVTHPDALQVVTMDAIPDPAPDTREVRLLTLNPGADPGRFLEGQQGILHRVYHTAPFPAAAWERSCSSSASSSSARRLAASSSRSSSCSRLQ